MRIWVAQYIELLNDDTQFTRNISGNGQQKNGPHKKTQNNKKTQRKKSFQLYMLIYLNE